MSDLRSQVQAGLGEGYTLERELGGGGMSRVFVARDETLGRHVVVKVIAPELAEGLSAERFTREVRLAARLQQANIVPVLTAGTAGTLPYFTMPFVRGESLRARLSTGQPVPVTEAVGILRDVARALAYAHGEGVVHRDIKPENILLSGGAAVVADFGIAKAISASRTQEGAQSTGITQAGTSLGTPAYMAPEQALGDAATDHRADLYAWGVVAWELLAGAHPFAHHTTMQALVAAHIAEPAPALAGRRPELPAALSNLVMRCLEKDPLRRPAGATEILAALEGSTTPVPTTTSDAGVKRTRFALAAAVVGVIAIGVVLLTGRGADTAAAVERSLAVLPFTASSGDTANAYLAEGIADEVSNSLSQIPGLRLAGRSSAARFAGKSASAQEVGAALNVATVLDGTVRRVGNQIRVSVEMSDSRDGTVIWREQYARPSTDVFAVQDEIARAIAGQLQVTLSGSTNARGTRDTEAYDLYLKGIYLYRRRTGPALSTAITHFEQAITRDSNFARAWAGLAGSLTVLPYFSTTRMGAVLPRAREAAEHAVRLDPALSEARVALGFVHGESFEFAEAERELFKAIELDSNAVEPRYRLGWLYLNMGRSAEAIPVLQQAKARDPLYFLVATYLGWAQLNEGLVAEGVAEHQRAITLEPENLAALSMGIRGYTMAGQPDSAIAVARRLVALTDSPVRLGAAALGLARSGQRAEAEALVRQMEAMPEDTWTRWTGLANGYAGLGDIERAIHAMQQAAAGDGDLLASFATSLLGTLSADPRIDAVYRRFNLDPDRFARIAAKGKR